MAQDTINLFRQAHGRFPGNNKQWWVAKADTDDPDSGVMQGDFQPLVLDKVFAGNNQAPKGHFILNEFNKDRTAVSGVPGIPTKVINERPTSVAFFSGRAWYACNSTVYFSQLLTGRQKAGLCYQEADPTSEEISDLIATDGGVIPIPEASNIIRLLPNAGGIMVFANNGVWFVTGTQAGFSALDFSVNKVSPIGCRSPMSVIDTDQAVFWWSDTGIMGASQQVGQYGPTGGFEKQNISELTIQKFYNDIPMDYKQSCKAVYDQQNNTVLWLYQDSEVEQNVYNRVLLFDATLNSFYPWKFSTLVNSFTPKIKGFFLDEWTGKVCYNFVAPNTTMTLAFVDNSTSFTDWKSRDGEGVRYSSYLETGYELMNDAMRKKAITYIHSYFRKTEDTWSVDSNGNEYLNNQSSCYLQVKFDWANTSKSNKWTTPVQAYRLGRFLAMDENVHDTGYPIVATRNKVRGNGKSIQFRYGTDEPGRDFDLHGWSVSLTGNTLA